MTQNVRDVMRLLDVDKYLAEKVVDQMECAGLDFSECTNREFAASARESLLVSQSRERTRAGHNQP